MKNSFALILILFAIACQQTKQNEKAIGAVSGELILDSLMIVFNEDDLITRFGKRNVTRDSSSIQDGVASHIVTKIFEGSTKEVTFIWNDSITFSRLNSIIINKPGNEWETREGIKIGTSLTQLVKLNDKAVEFSGLGLNNGGIVFFNNGLLQQRGMTITLTMPERLDDKIEADSLLAEQRISSEWSISKKINPVVKAIRLSADYDR